MVLIESVKLDDLGLVTRTHDVEREWILARNPLALTEVLDTPVQ